MDSASNHFSFLGIDIEMLVKPEMREENVKEKYNFQRAEMPKSNFNVPRKWSKIYKWSVQ
jgi:hypothetical protein